MHGSTLLILPEVSGIRISKDLLAAAIQKQIIQGLVEVSHLEERILRFYPRLFPQAQQRDLENIKTSFERAKTTHADPHVALKIADRLFTMSGAYEQSKDKKESAHTRSLLDRFHRILLDATLQNLTELDRDVEEALKDFEKKTIGKNMGGLA